jgi:hypothetical protein
MSFGQTVDKPLCSVHTIQHYAIGVIEQTEAEGVMGV